MTEFGLAWFWLKAGGSGWCNCGDAVTWGGHNSESDNGFVEQGKGSHMENTRCLKMLKNKAQRGTCMIGDLDKVSNEYLQEKITEWT